MVGRGQKEYPIEESSFDILENTNEFTETQKDGFTSTFKKKCTIGTPLLFNGAKCDGVHLTL